MHYSGVRRTLFQNVFEGYFYPIAAKCGAYLANRYNQCPEYANCMQIDTDK